jgi:hypothetical protein
MNELIKNCGNCKYFRRKESVCGWCLVLLGEGDNMVKLESDVCDDWDTMYTYTENVIFLKND